MRAKSAIKPSDKMRGKRKVELSSLVSKVVHSKKRMLNASVSRSAFVGAFALAGVLGLAGTAAIDSALAQAADPAPPLRLKSNFLGYAFSVSPRVTYSDNIDLVSESSGAVRDQAILSNLFTANAIVATQRFTALFSGDLDFSYLVEDDEVVVNQQVGAAGTATIVDNYLYLDIAGGTARQLVGDNAASSANINAARGERVTVNSYSVSPYVYHEFANESVAEVRYRFSQAFIDNDGIAAFLNDSRSQEVLASYSSGNLFDRLQFVATAYGNTTDEEGATFLGLDGNPVASPDFSFEQGTLSVEAQYALNSKFALSGAIGYDEIDTNSPGDFFDDDELSGIFWRAGFVARPGPRTRVRLEYGRRFDDDFIQADASYQISRRFRFTAGANRTFQTRALSNSTQIRDLSRRTLNFADTLREGGTGNPRDIIQQSTQLTASGNGGFNAQTVGVGPSNNAFASLVGVFDKTTISANANYQNSDFGFRGFENVNASVNLNRTLSRRVSLFGSAAYRYADTGFSIDDCLQAPGAFGLSPISLTGGLLGDCTLAASLEGVTHTATGIVGANYRLTGRARVFGEYSHTQRFSNVDDLRFSENAVTLGLVLDF